jgi:poly(hydroxyalkanoate) granule-associated protein
MAARKKQSTARPAATQRRRKSSGASATLVDSAQHVWLAGMGAIARAQKDGPAAFQDAVAEGLRLLSQSRSSAQEMIRDAFENAQSTVQSRMGGAAEHAQETWDNLESLFQSRVQKSLLQLGVPNGDEVRALTRRVEELNAAVLKLAGVAGPAAKSRRGKTAAAGKTRRKTGARTSGKTTRSDQR